MSTVNPKSPPVSPKAAPASIIRAVMNYFNQLAKERAECTQWATRRKRFTAESGNAFFIGVLLDQTIPFERAWAGGKHMVENHFQGGNFWANVRKTRLGELKKIARSGKDGQAYFRFPNKFAERLKCAAEIIIERYDGDVRKLWEVGDDVDLIYERLKEFSGIGDALARMGQFELVRKYGVAGGAKAKKRMCVKPDVHVNRVTYRLGLVSSTGPRVVARELGSLELESPADFDLAVWRIGQYYCHKSSPNCKACPLARVCNHALGPPERAN